MYEICLIVILCFFVYFSRSEIQSVALRLASKVISHHMQTCVEVRLVLILFWDLGFCVLIYSEGVSKSEQSQQAEPL